MYLLCDIDGVLIPFPGKDGSIRPSHYRDQVTPTGHNKPVTIWLNPAHGPLLDDLITDTGIDPVWCTSWRADAAALIGPRLGLPPWPHVDRPRLPLTDSHPNGYLWKRDHATAHINGEPCAWIDDDFTPADHDWASTRTATGRPTLLIQPNPHDGLLAAHVDVIRQWASSVGQRRRPIGRSGCHRATGSAGSQRRVTWPRCRVE
jgi:hypothetical protein